MQQRISQQFIGRQMTVIEFLGYLEKLKESDYENKEIIVVCPDGDYDITDVDTSQDGNLVYIELTLDK